jgi:hypothetical protein
VTATSLSDFAEILNSVNPSSIQFHYPRGDFQTLIRDIFGDNELADRLCLVSTNLPAEELAKELQKIVKKRINELLAQPYGMSKETV